MFTSLVSKFEGHLLGIEHFLQFTQLLVQNHASHLAVHIVEHDDGGQTVDKFGLERLFHLFEHSLSGGNRRSKAHRSLFCELCSGIAGHDEHDIAEHRFASLIVAQGSVVHHLQEQIEHVVVGLLDFVKQEHTVGMLAHGIGQQATVIISYITCGRADKFGNRMLLDILTHVEAHQFHTHFFGQDTCHLGFSYARGANKQQRR